MNYLINSHVVGYYNSPCRVGKGTKSHFSTVMSVCISHKRERERESERERERERERARGPILESFIKICFVNMNPHSSLVTQYTCTYV